MNDKVSKIIEKVANLRKLAGGTHSKNEKEAALALAAKMIAEFQLSELQIEEASGNKSESDDVTAGKVVFESGRTSAWKQNLIFGVARLNNTFCLSFPIRDFVTHRRGSRYRVFGKPSDMEITAYSIDFLIEAITALVDVNFPKGTGIKRGVNPERESFCLGCVSGFLAKMNAEKNLVFANVSSSMAMVLVNRQEELKDAYIAAHTIPGKQPMKIGSKPASKAGIAGNAYSSGYRQGQNLSVSPGMNAGEGTKRIG